MNVAAEVERRWGVPPKVLAPQDKSAGSSDFEERLAALEERTKHLATSAEVEQLRTEVAKANAGLDYMKWILGVIAAGLLLILGKLFLFA